MNADADFVLRWETIEVAFKSMKRGLKMSPWQFGQLFKAIGEWVRCGESSRDLYRRVGPVLAYEDWSWPWFDTCAMQFDAAGIWPRQWHRDGIAAGARWRDVPKGLGCSYLAHTLASACYSTGNAAQTNAPDVLRHFVATLTASAGGCAAEQLACELYRGALEAGDFGKLPPYFPMCGVRISVISRSKFGR